MKELVNKYKPEVFWSDGDWEPSWEYWNSTDFIAWFVDDDDSIGLMPHSSHS